MTSSGFSFLSILLNIIYIALAIAVVFYARRLFKQFPMRLWGDVATAVIGIAAFALFLGDGWRRMLLELNDDYPTYFALAYMPLVAFVAIAFVRSTAQAFQSDKPVMAMAAASPDGNAAAVAAQPPDIAAEPAKPPSVWAQRLKRGFGVVLMAVAAITVVARFMARNDLPACDAQQTRDVIAKIYTPMKIEFKRYDSVKTNSTATDLITCTAAVTTMDNAKAELDYDIRRADGGQFEVKVTGARDK